MTETRRHVLIWLSPDFLKSSGMVQLFTEAGIFVPPESDLNDYIRAAEEAGGFALTGRLVEIHHGAGIWISPETIAGLELMIPWQFVKSVVTAETPQSSKMLGFKADLIQPGSATTKQDRKKSRTSLK